MTSQKMMCPACVGHGKFADDTVCETCKGTGHTTVAAGRKYIASDNQADAPAVASHPKRAGASASKGSKKRARKAGNVSKRTAEKKATASVVTE